MYQFKGKNLKIKPYPMCLGNILKYFTIDNMRKRGFKGYVHAFFVDYNIFILTKFWIFISI